jgi:hypothetical protein
MKEPIRKAFEEPIKCSVTLNRSTRELFIDELSEEPTQELFVTGKPQGDEWDEKLKNLRKELMSGTMKDKDHESAEEGIDDSEDEPIKDLVTITLNIPQTNLFKGLQEK